jgi:uncharacterized protein YjbI with pentapeptide repeats/GTPase SAR1 family protein
MASPAKCKGFPEDFNCDNKPIATEKLCSSCKGRKFEFNVADLFMLHGYSVNRDELVSGAQTDLVICLQQGKLGYEAIVECKDHKDPIGNSDIERFWARTASSQFTKGYFISRNGFTASSKTYAKDKKEIELLTYMDLVNSLGDFSKYIDDIIKDYESYNEYANGERLPIIEVMGRCDLYKYYVPLNCYGEDVEPEPIEDFISNWYDNPSHYYLAVLGDYGTGKSSFCLNLTYNLAKKYKTDPVGRRIPVHIPLRDYNKAVDIRQLVTNLLINQYRVKIASYEAFEKLLDSGRLVLILDGFDEMATKVDKKVTIDNFRELTKLSRPGTKTILTCRTHYFKTSGEATSLLSRKSDTELMAEMRQKKNYKIIFLNEFSPNQIKLFLQKHSNNWEPLLKQINSTYNLTDLSKRPVLLDIIVKTLPRIDKGVTTINSTSLYDTYTNYWIEHDDWRSNMSCNEKAFFTMELAHQMLAANIEHVHFSDLSVPIKKHFRKHIQSHSDLDYFDNDIRTCSFLNRDSSGNYGFIHKSFMEYFVARKITESPPNALVKNLSKIILTQEICFFIKNMIFNRNDYLNVISSARNNSDVDTNIAASNAISILNAVNYDFSDYDFSNLDITGSIFSNGKFMNTNFTECTLKQIVAHTSNLEGAKFKNVKIIESDLTDSSLIGCTIEGSEIVDTRFVGSNLSSSKINAVKFKKSKLDNCWFKKSNTRNSSFSDSQLRKSKWQNSDLFNIKLIGSKMNGAKVLNASLNKIDFQSFNLLGTNFKDSSFKNCTFDQCKFNMVNFDYCNLENVQFMQPKYINRIRGNKDIKIKGVIGLSANQERYLRDNEALYFKT